MDRQHRPFYFWVNMVLAQWTILLWNLVMFWRELDKSMMKDGASVEDKMAPWIRFVFMVLLYLAGAFSRI